MINPIGIELKNAKKKKNIEKSHDYNFNEKTVKTIHESSLYDDTNANYISPLPNESLYSSDLSSEGSAQEEEIETLEEGQLSVDVYQTNKEIIVMALIAGVEKEDIQIAITDDILSIKGTRRKNKKIPDSNYLTQECFWGVFSRSIVLPTAVDKNKIKATYTKNGLLTITIPKIKVERTHIIHIAD